MATQARAELDDLISMQCFKAVIIGMEDILGVEGTASAMIAAGRRRGAEVAKMANLAGGNPPVSTLAGTLNSYFGAAGTRLCKIVDVIQNGDGSYLVKTAETVCTSGEPAGSKRSCTYTLGAVMGFLESVYGKTMTGSHVASVLSGSATDDFLIKPLL